uniref:Vps16 n=1 Tax=Castula fusca TaxID=1454043 RepID=A0A2P1JI57_9CILI|nr:Vps16 [Castula fusca]
MLIHIWQLISDNVNCLEQKLLIIESIEEIIVLDSSISSSKNIEVIFPRKEGGIFHIKNGMCNAFMTLGNEAPITIGNVKKLSVTPLSSINVKNKLVAFINEEEDLILSECNLEAGKAVKFTLSNDDGMPESLHWCGDLALAYEDKVVIMDRNSKIEFPIKSSKGFACFSEADGIRVFTCEECYFIERVPAPVEKALGPNSSDASSKIIAAYQKYLKGESNAEDIIKGIKDDGESVSDSLKTLISAATSEFYPEYQKYLLKAASFGKNFIPPSEFDATELVAVVNHLRIVNQLHVPKVILIHVQHIVRTNDNLRGIQKNEDQAIRQAPAKTQSSSCSA